MEFTKGQLSAVISKHTQRENGLHDLMEIMLESMMMAERREYLSDGHDVGTKGNGFRPGAHTDRGASSRSGYRATGTGTFVRRYWRYCAIRRMR